MSEICEQTGKIGYASPQAAHRVVRRIRNGRHRVPGNANGAYQCEHCHQWHLASPRAK